MKKRILACLLMMCMLVTMLPATAFAAEDIAPIDELSQNTRAEAMTMINRVLNRLPEDEDDLLDGMNVWPDNKPGDWYYLAVQEATNSHDFTRKGDVHEHWTKMTVDPDWSRYQ